MEKVAKGGAIGGGAKSSLTCSYCPKVVKPSLFDRATFCEVCEACLIETKCLKEALGAIARVEGALDAKGSPDYTMAEAGLSTGRLKIFFKGLASLGGQVGYGSEPGTKVKTFRFVCLSCTLAAGSTPGRAKNAPAREDSDDEAKHRKVPQTCWGLSKQLIEG
eukprot:304086-Rhodomonas_salina.1